jgi:hypothetical protein
VTQKLRIVHCFRSPVGGIFRHVRDLTEAQAAAGHLVGIVCDSTTGGDFEERLFEELKPNLALGVSRTPMQRHIGPGDVAAAWRATRSSRNCSRTYCTDMAPRVASIRARSAHCCGFSGVA